MLENIEKLLEAMASIVNDDSMKWPEKKELIQKTVDEGHEIVFEEFLSWFETGDE